VQNTTKIRFKWEVICICFHKKYNEIDK